MTKTRREERQQEQWGQKMEAKKSQVASFQSGHLGPVWTGIWSVRTLVGDSNMHETLLSGVVRVTER